MDKSMERENVSTLLLEVMQSVFFDPGITIDDETVAEDVNGWDSLSHVRLLLAIEKKFSITIGPLEADRLKNVGELIDLIQKKMAG
ncbi:acyl carrier protein [Azospirillum sp. YIM B02556]|uniref:Acyl carrier protein n=1 Tax=Azospirillum endophyticum TaxID=2800326 RepID=A0ABS1FBI9_9PROT|nr:acyl carrier protein [Azospirillum endophyticum]MBK1840794.1 acyl carrier protein [Azospirillum endophyticum]